MWGACNMNDGQGGTRRICVCLEFLTDAHRIQIRQTAERLGFEVGFFDLTQKEEAREYLQNCEIFYGHTEDLVRSAPSGLKWYCCSFAGVEPYCKDPAIFANPDCLLSNTNCYGVTIAEHVVMIILMMLRSAPGYAQLIQNRVWSNHLPIRTFQGHEITTFQGHEVTLLGTGDIGNHAAQRLRAMGASHIIGLNRSGRVHNDLYDEVFSISQLDEVLPRTQILLMSLPSTPETYHIMDNRRLRLLPSDAYLVNVGRGTAIVQEDLIEVMNSGHLAGAALDVVMPEPLPKDNPLWSVERLLLTPHVAGNMAKGYTCDLNVSMFCEDLENYAAGRPLKQFVNRKQGY